MSVRDYGKSSKGYRWKVDFEMTNSKVRNIKIAIAKKKIRNKDFSLISINCNGTFLLHELGFRFNSPFINLWLMPQDFLKYCENIEHYRKASLRFVKEAGI